MGRFRWGKTVGALVTVVTVAAVGGCSSPDGTSTAKPAAVKTVSVVDATSTFKAAVEEFDATGGCTDAEPGTCWEQMQALMEPARTLRKAMNAEKSVGPEFWTDAYALIDKMEKGIAVGEDKGATAVGTNRPDVFGSAHELSDWLDQNPVS
ncbi:hypothetical protein GCM10020367_71710 [Streptomyces sannanensis]|uniref:Lipoprotein n=1 Tax=Streptomyces sannanensis TaxID=285536 RepID=A0ABP6SN85_9ACTN